MNALSDFSACLSPARAVLSARPAGLVTDVDGTISRIVDQAEKAVVDPGARALLGRLVPHLDLVAAVSGRPISQLMTMLDVAGMVYVGNHGLEWWEGGQAVVLPEAEPYLPAVAGTIEWLRTRLALPGVQVEDKGATATVHFRLCSDPAEARRAILQAIAECPPARGLRVADGRRVVNLLPPIRSDKGTALERLVHLRRLRGVVYLGDDVTDLDAFRALRSLHASGICSTLRIAVASPEAPAELIEAADCVLDSVAAVVALLEQIAEALERPSRGGQR